MEHRTLGRSGLKVSVLSMGTMTFGGSGVFAAVGDTGVAEARKQVDLCLEAGVNLIDTADMYSAGAAEEIVGEVLRGRRDDLLIATKVRFPMGPGPNDDGLSRHHIVRSCEASLRRLGTEHIDLYQLHERDGITPVEETLEALDLLQRQGKVRYVGASNFSAWHLMKALGVAERDRLPRFVSQQIHYTLQAREAAYELVPLALDQGVGIMVWSPLAAGLLSGKYRRDHRPEGTSRHLTSCATTWPQPTWCSPTTSAGGWTRSASHRCSTRTGTRSALRPTGSPRPTCRCCARTCPRTENRRVRRPDPRRIRCRDGGGSAGNGGTSRYTAPPWRPMCPRTDQDPADRSTTCSSG
jgi:aryl-alcohol dehydrogenase-like predicted oxidoreductase